VSGRSRVPSGQQLLAGAALLFAWCALWGEASVANLASGLVLVLVVGRLRLGAGTSGPIRPGALLRFGWIVVVDLIVSTVAVGWEILTPTDSTEEAIVAVQVPADARRHLLLIVVAVTVTPGTAVVDVDPERGTLYLHLLHCDRQEAVTDHVARLAALADAALPPPPPQEVSP
jgi:multicomponent Na+:H+ antiporter subunit E